MPGAPGWRCKRDLDNQSYQIENLGAMICMNYGVTRSPAEGEERYCVVTTLTLCAACDNPIRDNNEAMVVEGDHPWQQHSAPETGTTLEPIPMSSGKCNGSRMLRTPRERAWMRTRW